ncbi:AbrB family looped-hinge helix DNA binding protein [Pseudomonas sp. OG7]|nr:AbrB family looped-hinge helix DNA binding protein [Pseudomonas sp. OG7]
MPAIHEIATLTSKGQVTLPKSVRQILGVDKGGKIAFDVRGGGGGGGGGGGDPTPRPSQRSGPGFAGG